MTDATRDTELEWQLLLADCWADPALKQRLLQDPATVLKERGIAAPAGSQVKIHEDSDAVIHFVLPRKPAEGELSVEELQAVSGGYCRCREFCRGCRD
jgi:hypothetical protein